MTRTQDTQGAQRDVNGMHTYMTAREIGDRLRLHEKTILRLARQHRIPALRAGRAVRFAFELVEEALTQR